MPLKVIVPFCCRASYTRCLDAPIRRQPSSQPPANEPIHMARPRAQRFVGRRCDIRPPPHFAMTCHSRACRASAWRAGMPPYKFLQALKAPGRSPLHIFATPAAGATLTAAISPSSFWVYADDDATRYMTRMMARGVFRLAGARCRARRSLRASAARRHCDFPRPLVYGAVCRTMLISDTICHAWRHTDRGARRVAPHLDDFISFPSN